MKRIFAALICAVMFATMFIPVMAEEGENFLGEIGQIPCPYATPSIDGNIDASEGWSAAQYIDKTNTDGAWGGEEVVITGNIYRAYDDTNLYIAADISIPEFSLCEGEDWIETVGESGNKPGWDGDVFVFSLDPMSSLVDAGMANDAGTWYCFGLFEGNAVRTYRSHVNDGEITDIVPAAGSTTATGWKFEAAIPWETVCKDIDELTFGDVVLTPEDITKSGNIINASMIYYDRVFDPEAGERITGSRYATICTTCPDGLPGTTATPWLVKTYGIYLVLEAAKETEATTQDTTTAVSDTTTAQQNNETEIVTDDKGNTVTDDKGNKVTQKVNKTTTKKAATGSSTGGNAAQTFDIGVAMAFGALAVSGIGFVASKKRK